MRLAAVVLAAGESSRFGPTSKLLADVKGEALIRRVVRTALASATGPVIVVTGREREACKQQLSGLPVRFVHNESWADGMGGSVAAGVREAAADDASGVFIIPGDMPLLSPALLIEISKTFEATGGESIVFPVTPDGEQRNPVLWPRRLFPILSKLSGPQGAKKILKGREGEIQRVPVADRNVFLDVDTPADLAALAALLDDTRS